ncbi:tetratricopeptide repeat protein [Micromonospora sp. NBC_01699]|uniref:tetratricopeptide repeat protein n=1 Tax=Micromonospora sp. NBC_01699 TaxID=2975984 RepID=UPI002E2B80AB|nr:tetratricopeptide repeat protein [Micromonospora sp. NBC_01699]
MEAAGAQSVAIGGDLQGIVSTGSGATNVQVRATQAVVMPPGAMLPPSQVEAPPALVNLPIRPGVFVGRGDSLDRLDTHLAAPGGVVVQAVHGLGGIGKSTLAARWAAGRTGDFNPVWWITADTPAAINAGLVGLAVALQPELIGLLPSEALRERAVQWLTCHQGWLLVLDNVTDPADITNLLARAPNGRYLITSRRAAGWTGIAATIRLNVLDLDEAVQVVAAIMRDHSDELDLAGIAEVCVELGYLPLAVEQAGSFMAQAGVPPREYLSMLAVYPAAMYSAAGEGADAERTIARIWRVTLDRFVDEPLTADTLRVLAWYSSEAIPRTLLDGLAEPPAVAQAIRRLAVYNLLTTDLDAGTVTLHRLVQAVARTADPADPHRQADDIEAARQFAAHALIAALPLDRHDPESWPTYRFVLPHLEAFARNSPEHPDSVTGLLLAGLGAFLHEQGAVHQAIRHLERGVAALRDDEENDHLRVLAVQTLLANAYLSAGDLRRAITLHEQILAETQRIAGDDDKRTMAAATNLAAAYNKAGSLKRAIPLLEQTLADSRRLHGDKDPGTLVVASNLASVLQAKGDLRRAIEFQQQIVTGSIELLGPDHPNTLTVQNNLACSLARAGELQLAMSLHEEVLEGRRRVLGKDHPATLASANALAGVYEAAGDKVRGFKLYRRTYDNRRRVLGDDHPDTLTSAGDLADTYLQAGNYGRAISLNEKTLAARRRVLGDDHPDTLQSASNLAEAYGVGRRLDDAVPLAERTLADRRRVLGEHHPQTLISAINVACSYFLAGRLSEAVTLAKRTHLSARRVLGADHRQTQRIAELLAALATLRR